MEKKNEKGIPKLVDLTPSNSIENIGNYKTYLDDALEGKKIRNIALSGNYGSGKSSIISTYFEQSEYKNKRLQISLASFKKEDAVFLDEDSQTCREGDSDCASTQKNIIKHMEKNIINQILYQIPNEKIPLTSFRIKREMTGWQKIFLILGIFVIMSLIVPIDIFPKDDFTVFKYFLLSIFIIWISNIFLNYMPIKKLNFKIKNIETEIHNQNDELFEKYADEIVYLLEKSGKEILIIEDLDRFEYLHIFEKLRELNIKLNNKLHNSKKNNFVFIYAIKDDLFIEPKERTKFFDLIIPVIPYLNSANSYEKMKDLFKNEESDDKLLYLLSYYIDDMRLLLNIYNEFIVYKNEIKIPKEDNSKLLSMVVYKNLFNRDFEELKFRRGILYEIIDSVENYRNEMRNEVQSLKSNLEEIESKRNEQIFKIEEDFFIIWFKDRNSQSYSIQNIRDFVKNPTSSFYYKVDSQILLTTYEELKQSSEYKEKLELILSEETNEEKNIKDKIFKLEEKMRGRIKDLLSEKHIKSDQLFIYRLIKQGYIDEKYEDYINYNYKNKNDTNFVNSVFYNRRNIGFNKELLDFTNIENSLTEGDYEKEAVLNHSLLDYFMETKNRRMAEIMLSTGAHFDNNFVEYYYNHNPSIQLTYLEKIGTKLDLTKLDDFDDELIEKNLYREEDSNFEIILLKCWKDKLTNETEIKDILKSKTISDKLKLFFIRKLKTKIQLIGIDEKYYDELLENNKITPSIVNISQYFVVKKNMIDASLIKFINENNFIVTDKLGKDFFDKIVNINEINNDKYEQLFRKYSFDMFPKSYISGELEKEKIQILVDCGVLAISKEMIEFFEEKQIEYVSKYAEDVVKILLVNDDLIIKKLSDCFSSDEVEIEERKALFLLRINELELVDFKGYLETLGFLQEEKLVKIAQKKVGYFNNIIKDTPENRTILEYLKDNEVITEDQLNHILRNG